MGHVTWNEGDLIRKLRTEFHLGLDEFAAIVGVSITTANRLETGRTGEAEQRTLKKIGAAFGLSIERVLEAIPKSSFEAEMTEPAQQLLARFRQLKGKKPKKTTGESGRGQRAPAHPQRRRVATEKAG